MPRNYVAKKLLVQVSAYTKRKHDKLRIEEKKIANKKAFNLD